MNRDRVLPNIRVRADHVRVSVRPTAIVRFYVASIGRPTCHFRLFRTVLARRCQTSRLRDVVSLRTTIHRRLPVVLNHIIVALGNGVSANLPRFTYRSFRVAIVNFGLGARLINRNMVRRNNYYPIRRSSAFSFGRFLLGVVCGAVITAYRRVNGFPTRRTRARRLLGLTHLNNALFWSVSGLFIRDFLSFVVVPLE